MSGKGIILFGHGARNPGYVEPFERIRDAMQVRNPQAQVEIGFLELSQPTLEDAFARLIGRGIHEVTVVPIFFAPGRHILKDLPERAAAAMDRHPGLEVDIADAVGTIDSVVVAMAEYALSVV